MIRFKSPSRFTVLAFAALAVIVLPGAGCQPQKSTGPKEQVTIGVTSAILSSPIMIAQKKGFFSEEGLDVAFKYYPSGKETLEAMFAGEVDIATVAETPIVLNSFVRDDFAVFATFVYSYDDCKVIGRKDKGVSKPVELKGKKIGIVTRTAVHFFVHVYLTEHGIDPSAVKMIDFVPTDLVGALKEGKVDAIAIFEPYAYEAMDALPDKTVRLPKSYLYKETFNLTVMRSYAKEHPGVLTKIVKAVDRAITFIKQNRNESIAIINKNLRLEGNILASIWDDFVFELSLDHSLLNMLEDEARWAMTNRFTDKTKVPNYLGYFYLDAMKAVKPEAVTITK